MGEEAEDVEPVPVGRVAEGSGEEAASETAVPVWRIYWRKWDMAAAASSAHWAPRGESHRRAPASTAKDRRTAAAAPRENRRLTRLTSIPPLSVSSILAYGEEEKDRKPSKEGGRKKDG